MYQSYQTTSTRKSGVQTPAMGRGMPGEAIREALEGLALEIHAFGRDLAYEAGLLRSATKPKGLSLGDRAYLALGRHLSLPVLTTDRAWEGLEGGVEVRLLRS